MSLADDKFAWPKTHAVNARVRTSLQSGAPVPYHELVAATDDPRAPGLDPGMRTFLAGSVGTEKGAYTIFQYAVVLQDARGRVATFARVARDKRRGERNLAGRTLLVSGSRMMKPPEALASVLEEKLSFGASGPAGEIESLGMAFLAQRPRHGIARADYLFALYRIHMERNRLNGLVRENPDAFQSWRDPATIPVDELPGEVDRMLLGRVLRGESAFANDVLYDSRSRLADSNGVELAVPPFDVTPAPAVFISHDAGAQLKAFLLRDVLVKRSRDRLFPIVDSFDVLSSSQRFWPRIEALIERCDVFLVLVTAGTARSAGVQREIAHALALPQPPTIVVVRVDGEDEDVPESVRSFSHVDYRGRNYRVWHEELDGLVNRLSELPFRVGTLRAVLTDDRG